MPLIRLSPIAETLGVEEEERQLVDGTYTVTIIPDAGHQNSAGRISGGVLATLLDDTMARFLAHVLGVQSMMTLSLTVNYLQAVSVGQMLTVSVAISRTGDKISYAEGIIECDNALVARAIGTFGHAGPRFRNPKVQPEGDPQQSAVGPSV